jgi:DNA-binding MarR family transcriptional regulator
MIKTTSTSASNLDQLLMRAFYWVDESLQRSIAEQGGPTITHSQSTVILAVWEGITRPSAIAEFMGVSRQAIHQSLRELVKLNVVELVPDPSDGRAKLVQLSKTGGPLREMASGILEGMESELEARIGKRRVKHLWDALAVDWGEPVTLD